MRFVAILCSSLMLAACGVDGDPEAPTMSGSIGVSSDGVFGRASVHRGPVTVSVGRGGACRYCW